MSSTLLGKKRKAEVDAELSVIRDIMAMHKDLVAKKLQVRDMRSRLDQQAAALETAARTEKGLQREKSQLKSKTAELQAALQSLQQQHTAAMTAMQRENIQLSNKADKLQVTLERLQQEHTAAMGAKDATITSLEKRLQQQSGVPHLLLDALAAKAMREMRAEVAKIKARFASYSAHPFLRNGSWGQAKTLNTFTWEELEMLMMRIEGMKNKEWLTKNRFKYDSGRMRSKNVHNEDDMGVQVGMLRKFAKYHLHAEFPGSDLV